MNILDEVNRQLDLEGFPSIQKTTIFEDLKDLEFRVYKAPIERIQGADRRKFFLRYSDPDFSISNQPLNEAEAEQIRSSIQVLSRFRGLPQFDWIQEMVPKLQSNLGLVTGGKDIISFESNPEYSGAGHIRDFFNAILHRRVLLVTYQDFNSEKPYVREFHPYHLKQYNARWFVFGHDPLWTKSDFINLALDRVKDLQETDLACKDTETDWDEYFHDIVGVTHTQGKLVNIHITILDKQQAEYIRTKPMHHSQKPIRKTKNGHYTTSIRVKPNYELRKMLLSFGEKIVVTAPDDLKLLIRDHARNMASLYEDDLINFS
jgi:predicted DNA-binding transcriptional regulator YafY